jgi:hypothetical protein
MGRSLLLVFVLLMACTALAARFLGTEEHDQYVARTYLEADLVLVTGVVSEVTAVLGERDSVASDGWTHRWTTHASDYLGNVYRVIKGDYGDSTISFQSRPYVKYSRFRLIDPADSLYEAIAAWPFPDGAKPLITPRAEPFVIFLKGLDSTFVYIDYAEPEEHLMDLLRGLAERQEAYR